MNDPNSSTTPKTVTMESSTKSMSYFEARLRVLRRNRGYGGNAPVISSVQPKTTTMTSKSSTAYGVNSNDFFKNNLKVDYIDYI